MEIFNKLQYPESVVAAVKADVYRPVWDIVRVTELIDSPLIKRLTIKHWDELEIDCDDIVYSSLLGTAVHKYLAGFQTDAMVEHRWTVLLSAFHDDRGGTLTGQTDIFKPGEGIIDDIKTQSAYAFVFGQPSWTKQLNVYAELIEQHGYKVKELWISAFLRDWSKYEAMKNKNKDYPKHKFHRVRVNLWSPEVRQKFIQDRLNIYDNPDYVCSDVERWRRPTTWAVLKEGVKTARRVLNTEAEAKAWLDQQKDTSKLYIEERKGGCIRCNGFCAVAKYCPHKDI